MAASATVAVMTGETACGGEAHDRSHKQGARVDRSSSSCTHVTANVVDDPLAFLDTKEPERRVVLYASSERRTVVKYEIVGGALQYSLEQLAGDKSLVRPTHVTTFQDFKEKRLEECRRTGQGTVVQFFLVDDWCEQMTEIPRSVDVSFRVKTKLPEPRFAVQFPPRVMSGDSIRLG